MHFWNYSGKVTRGYHCVYQITYHLVLVTYKREKILDDDINELVIRSTKNILDMWGGSLVEAKADVDHIHMLISIPPKYSLSTCIGTIKQITAKLVHRDFSYLENLPSNGRLWGSGFYVSTVGETDIDTVREYIRLQGEPMKRGRPSKGNEPYQKRK